MGIILKRDSSALKCVFVCDFYKSDLNNKGGAENNDSVLISLLEKHGFEVEKKYSKEVSPQFIETNKKKKFIISNFVSLSEDAKLSLQNKSYIIYEHDHKYLKTRDPSKFPNFIAPKDQVINLDFYANSQAVICLSNSQADSVRNNLDISNVESIGCSLWSSEKLDFISSIANTPKEKDFCIVSSQNPTKGTREAIQFCQKNSISYDLIQSSDEKEFLTKLSQYKTLVFIPTVLESLCRLVVEAKMLNCKVMTKTQLLGASNEEWFGLNGQELIDVIRRKQKSAIKIFETALNKSSICEPQSKNEDITVILNCYRRPEHLKVQIKAIKEQSIRPKEIWLWVNYHEDNKDIDFSLFAVDKIFRNDYNWKFYGRFAGALLSRTKYIAMFDDDTIPGTRWLENCLSTMKTSEGILVGNGITLTQNQYVGREFVGWTSSNLKTIEVDLGGHAWFFKQEWLKYLWMERPYMLENGEDIQFSYLAQKYGKIKTYCPPHPPQDREMFSSLKGYEYGVDTKATSQVQNHQKFYDERNRCVKNALKNGWSLVKDRSLQK